MNQLIFLVVMSAAMWLLLIRPQQQRVKNQRQMVMSLDVGQLVVTAGGIIGTIVELEGDEMILSVGPDTNLRMLRAAVARPLDLPTPAVGEDLS